MSVLKEFDFNGHLEAINVRLCRCESDLEKIMQELTAMNKFKTRTETRINIYIGIVTFFLTAVITPALLAILWKLFAR